MSNSSKLSLGVLLRNLNMFHNVRSTNRLVFGVALLRDPFFRPGILETIRVNKKYHTPHGQLYPELFWCCVCVCCVVGYVCVFGVRVFVCVSVCSCVFV